MHYRWQCKNIDISISDSLQEQDIKHAARSTWSTIDIKSVNPSNRHRPVAASGVTVLKSTFHLEWNIVYPFGVLHGWFLTVQIRNNELKMQVMVSQVERPATFTLHRSDLKGTYFTLYIMFIIERCYSLDSGVKQTLAARSSRSHRTSTTGVVRYLMLL